MYCDDEMSMSAVAAVKWMAKTLWKFEVKMGFFIKQQNTL